MSSCVATSNDHSQTLLSRSSKPFSRHSKAKNPVVSIVKTIMVVGCNDFGSEFGRLVQIANVIAGLTSFFDVAGRSLPKSSVAHSVRI